MTSVKKLLPVEVKSINRSEGHVEVRFGGIDADGHRIHVVYYEEDPAKFDDFKKGDAFTLQLVGYVKPELEKSEGVKTDASTAQVDQKRDADSGQGHQSEADKDSGT